ncbi:MAG: hypothetical protein E3J64_01290, partial [Anaerolineales bacterium]
MDKAEKCKLEPVLALLIFLWGVQFTLLVLLFWDGLLIEHPVDWQPGAGETLSLACILAGSVFGIRLLLGGSWAHIARSRRRDMGFAYLALIPSSTLILFGFAGVYWDPRAGPA